MPDDIPANPNQTYMDKGWVNMGDWLGTGTIATSQRKYRSFTKARAFARSLNLKSFTEWRNYCKGEIKGKLPLPADIPANPNNTYKDSGWGGWGDWLGTGYVAANLREYRPFTKARTFARSLNLKSFTEWRNYCKGEIKGKPPLPADIPSDAYRVYKGKGWISWSDWLGTKTISTHRRKHRSFIKARVFTRSLKLKSQSEWFNYCKGKIRGKPPLPADIPINVSKVYKDMGWISWGDWLGTKTIATRHRKYRSFNKARAFARSLNLKSRKEWNMFCKGEISGKPPLPDDIPAYPNQTYKDKGWKSVGDWLGK